MQTVYRDNPKLGDIDQVELEIDKCSAELHELSAEAQKFQVFKLKHLDGVRDSWKII